MKFFKIPVKDNYCVYVNESKLNYMVLNFKESDNKTTWEIGYNRNSKDFYEFDGNEEPYEKEIDSNSIKNTLLKIKDFQNCIFYINTNNVIKIEVISDKPLKENQKVKLRIYFENNIYYEHENLTLKNIKHFTNLIKSRGL